MRKSVVDEVFSAHFARFDRPPPSQETFKSCDLDEAFESYLDEEFNAAYDALELSLSNAEATGTNINPLRWVQYAGKMLPVMKAVYKAIEADANSVQEDKSAYDVNNPPDLKGMWRKAFKKTRASGNDDGGDSPALSAEDEKAKKAYDKVKKFAEEHGLSFGKKVASYSQFKEQVRDWVLETKGMNTTDKMKQLVKNAIESFKKAGKLQKE